MQLVRRYREETRDHRVIVAADWEECREQAARLDWPETQLMQALKEHGVNALAITPLTLTELLAHHRVVPQGSLLRADFLDVAQIQIPDRALAQQIVSEFTLNNASGLKLEVRGKSNVVSRSNGRSFLNLKDIDLGYDAQLISEMQKVGLMPIMRVYSNPWIDEAHVPELIHSHFSFPVLHLGVLFSSDDVPGGETAFPLWVSWLKHSGVDQFLPEFHPTASAWRLARAWPASTFRAHSIPMAELRDLKKNEQLARWRRAVSERSCRLLLIHASAGDSMSSYLQNISDVVQMLRNDHYQPEIPSPRVEWSRPMEKMQGLFSIGAFGVALLAPFVGLKLAVQEKKHWFQAFMVAILVSVVGALLAAALAQNPETRLEIIPFRGSKLAFIGAWLLAGWVLYGRNEIQRRLAVPLKRWELLVGLVAAAAMAYLIIRTGNAPAALKSSSEQTLRDFMEKTLIARPRFKEFLLGHPFLLLGLYLSKNPLMKRFSWDMRPLIWVGMLGPISIVNTFCHLHSPLSIELLRTFNGWVLGGLLGGLGILVLRSWEVE